MSDGFQGEIRWFGIAASTAFIRLPGAGGCAECFIRMLKEHLLWVRTFETVERLHQALLEFQQTYNEHCLIERHGHPSSARFRRDQLVAQPIVA